MTSSTVDGRPIPDTPDFARLNGDRAAKLQDGLERAGLDGLVLLGSSNVAYATGALMPGFDASRALIARPVAVVARGDEQAHLYTPYPDGAAADTPEDRVHAAVFPDLDDGADGLAGALSEIFPPGARLAFDEMTHPLRASTGAWEVSGAHQLMAAAKVRKTVDELACIRTAQSINESAMRDVVPLLRPGVRQSDLTARFLRRIHELGATGNGIDPIWQPMPPSLAQGPWTTHGGVAFPVPTYDRFLREGDVVWVDTGIHFHGYASDFGRTWIVSDDPRPTARQSAQFDRWNEVIAATLELTKPGATALDLGRAATEANGGDKPWIEHFYLAHGIGTDSAEMPLVGTDLGAQFDERLTLAPGMVLVLEPVVWDDGAAGYRSEDVYAVSDDGWVCLSDFPYDPYGRE